MFYQKVIESKEVIHEIRFVPYEVCQQNLYIE